MNAAPQLEETEHENHARTLALCTLTAALLAAPSPPRRKRRRWDRRRLAKSPRTTAGPSAGSGGGLGIGAASYVSGMAGPQAVYDAGPWHAELMLGFEHHNPGGPPPTVNTFDLGLGGWYHLHAGDRSDFSVGGNIG